MKDLCMFIYDGLATTAISSDQPGYTTQLTVWLSKTPESALASMAHHLLLGFILIIKVVLAFQTTPCQNCLDLLQHTALRLIIGLRHLLSGLFIELSLHKHLLLAHLQVSEIMDTRIQSKYIHGDRQKILLLGIIGRDHPIRMHRYLGGLDLTKVL
ncbi:hypothetical protein AA0117_g13142 [Alternaria alternata]|uniref:Uncharacterized protein n=1 Tax=Alternaria alternata TaxID=5599 RepID=A0A4Q4MTN4_ALTAL|nr:hypothetical protein AA0117_g13142 [Alternaria alternata]